MAQFRPRSRAWGPLLVLLLALAVALFADRAGAARDQPVVPTFARAADWLSLDNIAKALRSAASLPRQSQKVILAGLGEAILSPGLGGERQCNLFGGSAACVPVPAGSDYSRLCASSRKLVDCAFRLEAEEHVSKDPDSLLRDRAAKEGYTPCPECYELLHKFWCAQTVPACGTFDKVVDEILPLISSVVLGKEPVGVALEQAVPDMLQAISLGLPCKKMCNSITTTCGCGQPATFGEVMTALQQNSDGYNTSMSSATSKDIFAKVWDKPVCDLFAEDTIPGFEGVCEVPAQQFTCAWCKGKSRPQGVHEQIVAQLAQTFSGMMQGGLEKILIEAGGKNKAGDKSWSWAQQQAPPESKKRNGGHTVAVVLITFVVLTAAGAVFVALRIHRTRQIPSQYIDLNSMGYTPPIL